jgi:tRNA pseudouridine38-40 synthase
VPTVQESLETAWKAVTSESVVMHGSGRTDSGVHAWGQVVHFSTDSKIPAEDMVSAFNAHLPEKAVVRAAADVPVDFHASSSSCGKRYFYRLALGATRPVLSSGLTAWDRTSHLDLLAMREAVTYLLGEHDFAAFAAAGRSTKTSVRCLRSLHIRPIRGGIGFFVEGSGFLYKMVRNLVGSLVEVGKGRRAPIWVETVLESRDRRRAGVTAAPEGLVLWRSLYSQDPFSTLL